MGLSSPILVVDDDPVSCELMTEILTGEGYEVESATSTAKALERFSCEDFRLVVTDVFMPGMPGTVLAWQLRQLRPEIPILFVSAFPNRVTEEDARTLGVSLLAKPFPPDALIERVSAMIRQA